MKHLLSVDDLSRDDIEMLFATAADMHDVQNREVKKLPALRSTPSPTSDVLPPYVSRSSWTAATASCRSAPTTSARTCPAPSPSG